VIVRVTASVDGEGSSVGWRLTALDPATGEQTTNPSLGVLEPSGNGVEGIGSVAFTVHPVAGIPVGTSICNEAQIGYDGSQGEETPSHCNLIGATNTTTLPPTTTTLAPTTTTEQPTTTTEPPTTTTQEPTTTTEPPTTTTVTTTTLPSSICGDANGNGSITATDALLVLQKAVGRQVDCPPERCDTDASGSIVASDSLRVLKKAVGQNLELECS